MKSPEDKYIESHSTPQTEALSWVERQTHIRTHYPQMLSGAVQGRFLTIIAKLMQAESILEIGTFTGYSSICLAYALPENGRLDALEINDEFESLIHEAYSRAGVEDKITLHIGDAKEIMNRLKEAGRVYDLVYIDANKREYCDYYEAAIDMVRSGGCIIADDVLMGGKVFMSPVPCDRQTRGLANFNNMAADDPRVETVILPIRDGLRIIRKK